MSMKLLARVVMLAALCGAVAAAAAVAQPEVGITIAAGAELPHAPAPIDRGYCRHLEVAPRSAAGRSVAGAGWPTISEEPLGALTAVSFVAGFRSMTSGACIMTGGRIGFFDGADLLALAAPLQPDGSAIGHLRRAGADRLRIWGGEMLPRPTADVMLAEGDPVIVPLPSSDVICDGTLTMPLVHGLTLTEAGELLAGHGWEPTTLPPPSDPLAAELAASGFTGTEHCSGTGFGFCSLAFVQGKATASVLTFGELNLPVGPRVADYDVICRGLPPPPE